jgi:hypothetical protein
VGSGFVLCQLHFECGDLSAGGFECLSSGVTSTLTSGKIAVTEYAQGFTRWAQAQLRDCCCNSGESFFLAKYGFEFHGVSLG